MNKIVLWVVLGIVVLGGLVYVGGKKNMSGDGLETGKNTMEKPSGKKMAFADFMKMGGSYKCTINQNSEGVQTTGTVFIDKNSTRGMFETTTNGTKVEGNFLMHNGYSYFWSSASLTGIKAAITENENQPQGMSEAYPWNPEQVGDYDCAAWSADAATFAVPVGIQFMDMAQMGGMYKK
jgi:hypothetical protein